MKYNIEDFEPGMTIRWLQDRLGHTAVSKIQCVYKEEGMLMISGPMAGGFFVGCKKVVEIISVPDKNNPNHAFKQVRNPNPEGG